MNRNITIIYFTYASFTLEIMTYKTGYTILRNKDQSHSNIHVASAAYIERPKVYVSVIFII